MSVHPYSTAGASSSASVVRFCQQLVVVICQWHCGCWLLKGLITGVELVVEAIVVREIHTPQNMVYEVHTPCFVVYASPSPQLLPLQLG